MLLNKAYNQNSSTAGLGIKNYIIESQPQAEKPEKLKKVDDPLEEITNIASEMVKCDATLIKTLVLGMFSTYTPFPVNIRVKAPYSEGKTYAVMEVVKMFPEIDTIVVGDMSPRALIRRQGVLIDKDTGEDLQKELDELYELKAETSNKQEREKIQLEIGKLYKRGTNLVNLENKILVFPEPPNMRTLNMLKPILSRDKYEFDYEFVDNPQANAKKETLRARLRGFPVMVYASVKDPYGEGWQEIMSRFITVSPNMDKRKYKHANKKSADKTGKLLTSGKIDYNHKLKQIKEYINELKRECTAQFDNIYKNEDIDPKEAQMTWNPMAYELHKHFPHEVGQNMRDFNDYMGLMSVSTLLALYQRPYMEIGGFGYWWTTIKDVEIIQDIFSSYHIFTRTGKAAINFLETVLHKLMKDSPSFNISTEGYKGYTKKEIGDATKKYLGKRLSDRAINDKYMAELIRLGYVDVGKDEHQANRNIYTPISPERWKVMENKLIKPKISFDALKESLMEEIGNVEKIENSDSGHKNISKNVVQETCNRKGCILTSENFDESYLQNIYTKHYFSIYPNNEEEESKSEKTEANKENGLFSNIFQVLKHKEGRLEEIRYRVKEIGETGLHDKNLKDELNKLNMEKDKLGDDITVLREIDTESLDGLQFDQLLRKIISKCYLSESKVRGVLHELISLKVLEQGKDMLYYFKR